MSRLIVVSNRLGPMRPDQPAAGGLAVAIMAALRQRGGIWFGWNGEIAEEPVETPALVMQGPLTFATLPLSQRDYEEYYNGFANATLWPLFHYRVNLATFSRRTLEGYRRVNATFARCLKALLRPDDVLWIHDYHLIPLGAELRALGAKQRMGFFLHIPFPAPEIVTCLPDHGGLIRTLGAYDLVGLQTAADADALRRYLLQEGHAAPLDEHHVSAAGRTVRIDHFPIGIETSEIERQAPAAGRAKATAGLVQSLAGRDLIIGVDRLDYSKGLPQRFRAFETLLERFPERRRRVTFMQIAPVSRGEVTEYAEIRRDLERLAGHINGRFAEFDWVPIRYLNRSVARRTLLGFHRAARVGVVTPLRDGMNLVAKEYVAAQDPDDPGVLVLSQFAGAAAELDAALLVNPYDVQGTAEALDRALSMPREERVERQATLIARLRGNDIAHWRDRFLAALAGPMPSSSTMPERSHAS